MAEHVLIIPVVGLLEVIHADQPIDAEATIRARLTYPRGEFMRLTRGTVTMSWLSTPNGSLNQRAIEAFRMVSTAYFVLTGPVLFQGIEENLMGEIVANLSMSA